MQNSPFHPVYFSLEVLEGREVRLGVEHLLHQLRLAHGVRPIRAHTHHQKMAPLCERLLVHVVWLLDS